MYLLINLYNIYKKCIQEAIIRIDVIRIPIILIIHIHHPIIMVGIDGMTHIHHIIGIHHLIIGESVIV